MLPEIATAAGYGAPQQQLHLTTREAVNIGAGSPLTAAVSAAGASSSFTGLALALIAITAVIGLAGFKKHRQEGAAYAALLRDRSGRDTPR
jgi:hypothetical protein